MYALFIVLNEADYLETILDKFMEVGVKGATILDSQGMGGAMADRNLPLFGSLKTLFDGARPFNKTIFSVIPNEELLNRTVAAVKEVAGSIEKPSAGFMFTMPVANVYSLGSEHNQE